MNIALWIVQGVLAAIYAAAGSMKLFMTATAQKQLPWAAERPVGFVRFVGTAELLGALGIVLPLALGILPILTVLAAVGLGAIQVLAVSTVHIPRKELNVLPINAVLLALAVFTVVGRWAAVGA